ncbi:MAG: hypothetical protein ASARMPRED_003281 [Alectoria sarmentosa]|nr:MAG: hypothetical protein ASARMPRED_003281 [Alectoria sarmentosa]
MISPNSKYLQYKHKICDDADKLGAKLDPSVVEYWNREWEKQKGRAGEFNAAVEDFMVLETEEKNDSKTRSRVWKEQFNVVVGKMEIWAVKMREILSEKGVKELIAEDEEVVPAEGAKTV